jgi:hypothetical protein
MTPAWLVGHLVRAATAPAYCAYLRSLDDPAAAQARLFRWVVRAAAAGGYGRRLGLRHDASLTEFRERVPVARYDDLKPWIERAVSGGDPGALSPHPVVRVEATSGSTSGVKWVPYTRPMMGTFSRMFSLWAHDLLQSGLYRPRTGRLFLCVTGGRPGDVAVPRQLSGDDRDYLGRRWRRVLEPFVVAPQLSGEAEPLRRLAETMAAQPGLEVMSFWSPSLLLAALDELGIDSPDETRRLWPRLQLISCWTAASSALFVPRLARLFPDVRLQGKGLLATEAAMTIPLARAGGCVPLLDDVFFEFEGEGGSLHPCHELSEGASYEVLLSNRSGMLRYRIGDRVRVDGFFRGAPVLAFVGRAGVVSDLVGEKLSVEFVEREVAALVGEYFCLVPDSASPGYEVWLDPDCAVPVARIEAVLSQVFHYGRARRLGQLAPLRASRCPRLAGEVRRCLEGGVSGAATRAFKPPLLVADLATAGRLRAALQRTAAVSTG